MFNRTGVTRRPRFAPQPNAAGVHARATGDWGGLVGIAILNLSVLGADPDDAERTVIKDIPALATIMNGWFTHRDGI